jgi:hypothetical protein
MPKVKLNVPAMMVPFLLGAANPACPGVSALTTSASLEIYSEQRLDTSVSAAKDLVVLAARATSSFEETMAWMAFATEAIPGSRSLADWEKAAVDDFFLSQFAK